MPVRALVAGLGLWGLVLTLGLLTGHLKLVSDPGYAPEAPETKSETGRADAGMGSEPGQHPASTAPPVAPVPRYRVCKVPVTTTPRLGVQRLGDTSLLSVHCGDALHWLSAGTPPRIEASLALRPRGASLAPVALSPVVIELGADRTPGFAIGTRHDDGRGTPVEGGLWQLPRGTLGQLASPLRMAGGLPLQLLAGRFDGETRTLAWLEAGTQGRPNQLWVAGPGAAPEILFTIDAADARAATAVDLDLDGDADVVMAGAEASARWWRTPTGEAPATPPEQAPLGELREVTRGDLNADGHEDALLVGRGLWVLRASSSGTLSPTPIEGSECEIGACPRDVAVFDVDTDGKLDIVQYAHPAVQVLRNRGGLAFEARPLTQLLGRAIAVVQTLADDFDGDGRLDLAVLGREETEAEQLSLSVVHNVASRAELHFGGSAVPLPVAPLRATLRLR